MYYVEHEAAYGTRLGDMAVLAPTGRTVGAFGPLAENSWSLDYTKIWAPEKLPGIGSLSMGRG